MNYLWTEDRGAGFHFWKLMNEAVFNSKMKVESKQSNQGLLDAVRGLNPDESDIYFIAFDVVYDNMDVVNKYLQLQEIINKYSEQIKLLDITCFEYFILSFNNLVSWTAVTKRIRFRFEMN